MKKFFLLIFALFIGFACVGCQKHETLECSQGDFSLVKVTNGEKTTLAYLFPVFSDYIKDDLKLNSTILEGYKFYLKANILLIQDVYKLKSQNVAGVAVSQVKFYTDYDSVGFELNFDDSKSMQDFFGSSDEKLKSVVSGFFIKRTAFNVSFPFSLATIENYNAIIKNVINSWATTFELSSDIISRLEDKYLTARYSYECISKSNILRGDINYEQNGVYHAIFVKTKDEISENGNIDFYNVSINKGVWYLMVLLIIGGTVLIMELIILKKTKFKTVPKS